MGNHGSGGGRSGNGAGRPPGASSGSMELKVPQGMPPEIAKAMVQQTIFALQRMMPLLEVGQAFEAAQQALLTEVQVQQIWAAHAAGAKTWGIRITRPSKVRAIQGGDAETEAIGYITPTRVDEMSSMEDVLKHVSLVAILTSPTARALFFAHGYKITFHLPPPEEATSDQPPSD